MDALLSRDFRGTLVQAPPATGPRAQRGKTVWLLSCPGFEGCVRIDDGVFEAARALGWNVKLVNDNSDPTQANAALRQAIAARAAGVVMLNPDCPTIKAGLLAAKAANMPVVNYGGLDCNYPGFGGGQPLFSAPLYFTKSGKDQTALLRLDGIADADMVAALVKKAGIKNPTVLQSINTDQVIQAAGGAAFATELKRKCPACQIDKMPFTVAQLASGKGQQIYKSSILSHPTANILYYAWDAQLSLGLESALLSHPGQFKIICCGDGGIVGLANIRKGLAPLYVDHSLPYDWIGWAMMDVLNRLFAGESRSSIPPEGWVLQYVDHGHNLPSNPKAYPPIPVNYQDAYRRMWGR